MLRAVELARNQDVPIHARSTFSTEPGRGWQGGMEQAIVSAVTHSGGRDPLRPPRRPRSARLGGRHLRSRGGRARQCRHDPPERGARVGRAVVLGAAGRRSGDATCARPSAGEHRSDRTRRVPPRQGRPHRGRDALAPGVAARMFRTLADEEINLRPITTSPIKVSCPFRAPTSSAPSAPCIRHSRSAAVARRVSPEATAEAPRRCREPWPRHWCLGRAGGRGSFLLLSSFAIWINRVALNTSVFSDTSSALPDNDEIRSAVANRAVDELFANVDVQEEVETQLPADYKGLSGAATPDSGKRRIRSSTARSSSRSSRTSSRSPSRSRTRRSSRCSKGRRPGLDLGRRGHVDLRAIMIEAADRIGIGDRVVDRIPDDAGRIVILRPTSSTRPRTRSSC